MAYGKRYTAAHTLTDSSVLTVDIYKDGYASSVDTLTVAEDGVSIKQGDASADILAWMRDCEATVTFIADADDASWSDMETGDDTTWLLHITRDSTTLFEGLIDIFRGGRYQRDNAEVVIVASGWSKYLATQPVSTYTRQTLLSLIKHCVTRLPTFTAAYTYKCDCITYPDGVTTGNPLTQIYVDADQYRQYTRDGEQKSAYALDVLRDIVQHYGLTITAHDQTWHIQQIPQYESGTITRYTYDSNLSLTGSAAANNTFTATLGTNVFMVGDFPLVRRLPNYGQINVLFNHLTKWEYVRNGSFSEVDAGAPDWAEHWTRTEQGVTGDQIYLNTGFDVPIPVQQYSNNQHAYLLAYYDDDVSTSTPKASQNKISQALNIDFASGSSYTLKFSTKVERANFTPYSAAQRRMHWRLHDGTNYWSEATKAWTTSNTYNSIWLNPDDQQIDHQFELDSAPSSAQYTLEIYTIHDELVTDTAAGLGDPYDPADWDAAGASSTVPDIVALRVDGVWIDDGLSHPVAMRTHTFESTDPRYRFHEPLDFLTGDGPESHSTSRHSTDASGDTLATNFDGLGFTDKSLDTWLGNVYLKYKGEARVVKEMSFREITASAFLEIDQTLTLSSERYVPLQVVYRPLTRIFSGVFLKFTSKTTTTTSIEYDAAETYATTNAISSAARTGGGTTVITITQTQQTPFVKVDDLGALLNPSADARLDLAMLDLDVSGNATIDVAGTLDITPVGNTTLDVTGTLLIEADDHLTVQTQGTGKNLILNASQKIQLNQDTDIGAGISVAIPATGNITNSGTISGSGNFRFGSSADFRVDGATVGDSPSDGEVLTYQSSDDTLRYLKPKGLIVGSYGNRFTLVAEAISTLDDTFESVSDLSSAAIGTNFDDANTVTLINGLVTIYREGDVTATFDVWASVTTNASNVQTLDASGITERDQSVASRFAVQFAISSNKLVLQTKDTDNLSENSRHVFATFDVCVSTKP